MNGWMNECILDVCMYESLRGPRLQRVLGKGGNQAKSNQWLIDWLTNKKLTEQQTCVFCFVLFHQSWININWHESIPIDNSITPGGAAEAGLQQFLQVVPRQTLRLVFFVLDKMVTEAIVVLVDDHSPNDKDIGPLEYGGGAFFVLVDVLFVEFLVFGPVDAAVLSL